MAIKPEIRVSLLHGLKLLWVGHFYTEISEMIKPRGSASISARTESPSDEIKGPRVKSKEI